MKFTNKKIVWLLCLLVLVLLVSSNCTQGPRRQDSPTSKDKKELYDALKQVCETLPISPTLRRVESRDLIRNNSGVYSIIYESKAKSNEVKDFYSKFLIPQGWNLSEGTVLDLHNGFTTRKLIFSKEAYRIRVTFEDEDAPRDAWTCVVECSWSKDRL